MSTTPRTDSEALVGVQSGGGVRYFNATADDYQPCIVSIDFARTLETELAQAKSECEALRKDKERLDFLIEKQVAVKRLHRVGSSNGWEVEDPDDSFEYIGRGKTPRQAIDAAASKAREGK